MGASHNTGGGGQNTWETLVTEDGSTITNWTSISGTWADGGDHIEQQALDASYYGLALTTDPGYRGVAEVQFDVHFPDAENGAGEIRGMVSLCNRDLTTVTYPWVGLACQQAGGLGATFQQGDQAADQRALTVNLDTWYTVKVIFDMSGGVCLYVDGSFAGTFYATQTTNLDRDSLVLITYQGHVEYRNISLKTLAQPS